MPSLLTRSQQMWARAHRPKYIRGTALNPNISDAVRYKRRLDALIDKMIIETERELKKLFQADHAEEYFAKDASISSQARITTNALTIKFDTLFLKFSKQIAEQVANEADKSSSVALHSSLKELSGGLSLSTTVITPDLKEILNATVTENVALIKSIPQQYLSGVQQATMRSIVSGNGLQDLVPYLQKHKQITYKRAKFIAYDQTRKAFNGLCTGRMEKLGIDEFEWLHSGGSNHPRKDHIELSGKVFSLKDPPITNKKTGLRSLPGFEPGCRCRKLPVIKFEE